MLFELPDFNATTVAPTADQKAKATERRRTTIAEAVLLERRACAAEIVALRKSVSDDSFPDLDEYLRPLIEQNLLHLKSLEYIWSMLKAGCDCPDGFTTPEGFVRINIRDLVEVPAEYERILSNWKVRKAVMEQAIIDRVHLRDTRLKELQPGVPITAYYGNE